MFSKKGLVYLILIIFILSIWQFTLLDFSKWGIGGNFHIQDLGEKTPDNFPNISETHWKHVPVTYRIKPGCNERQINLIKLAFQKIKNETSSIVYFEESITPDILISCIKFRNSKDGFPLAFISFSISSSRSSYSSKSAFGSSFFASAEAIA